MLLINKNIKQIHKFILYITVMFFIFILWIIYKVDTGQDSLFFDLIRDVPYGDKMGHFILFGLLVLGVNIATKFKQVKIGAINIFVGTVLVFMFVLVEELSQYFLPMRTLDIMDLCADIAGIILFSAISYSLSKRVLLG